MLAARPERKRERVAAAPRTMSIPAGLAGSRDRVGARSVPAAGSSAVVARSRSDREPWNHEGREGRTNVTKEVHGIDRAGSRPATGSPSASVTPMRTPCPPWFPSERHAVQTAHARPAEAAGNAPRRANVKHAARVARGVDVAFRQVLLGPMKNFSYVFGRDGKGVVVDPGFDAPRLAAIAREMGLAVETILVTHGHWDHVAEVDALRKLTGARVAAHPLSPARPDLRLADGEVATLAGVEVRAVHTPGHEPTSICYVVDDRWLLTGDTLFIGECGRADLPGSDPGLLWESLHVTLAKLPGRLVVCPGHDYGATPTDTLENQRKTNTTLAARSKAEFVAFMAEP